MKIKRFVVSFLWARLDFMDFWENVIILNSISISLIFNTLLYLILCFIDCNSFLSN